MTQLSVLEDFKDVWDVQVPSDNKLASETLIALQALMARHPKEKIPLLFRDKYMSGLVSILSGRIPLTQGASQHLYISVYMLLVDCGVSFQGGLSFEKDFLDLRLSLEPSYNLQLVNDEIQYVSKVFSNAKVEHDFDVVRDYLDKVRRHEEQVQNVEKSFIRVEELTGLLEKHETAFNFVGLYDGFEELRKEKRKELGQQNKVLYWLGGAAVTPLLLKFIHSMFVSGSDLNIPLLITVGGMELVLIYFFRIALHSVNSIKAQLLQIDLRRTLCQFVQDYVKYSADVKAKTPNALDKFETLIFSGLVMQDDKLPATFDGLEPIQKIFDRRPGSSV